MPYGLTKIETPNMVDAYNKGEQRGYDVKERKRKQPILEAMESAKLKQNAQTIEKGKNALTLQQGKIQQEAYNSADKGMDWINEQSLMLTEKGATPEQINQFRTSQTEDLYNHTAQTYGKKVADEFQNNPELMAKVAGGQQPSKNQRIEYQRFLEKGKTPEEVQKMRDMAAGLIPKSGTKGVDERVTDDPSKAKAIIDYKARTMKAKEDAKWLSKEEATLPQAEVEYIAAERKEVFDDEMQSYKDMKQGSLRLDQLEQALNSGASTGKYGQLSKWAGQYMPGVDIGSEENLIALASQYALDELSKQKGSKSDFEFLKAAETAVQQGNTKEGNALIFGRLRQNQRYAKERYNKFRDYKKDNKDIENFEETFEFSEFKSKPKLPTINSMSGYKRLKSGDQYYDSKGRLATKQ
jgi:hypothetical protein